MKRSSSLLVLPLSFAAVACVGSAANDVPETNANVQAQKTAPAPDLSGTWRFDLDASEVATAVRAECGARPDPPGCWAEIAAQARLEKIRVSTVPGGHTEWSSFAADPKGEILFLSLPVDVSPDGPGRVLVKVAGEAKGKQAAQFARSNINQLRVDLLDARRIAVIDPRKGSLVYEKE